MKNMNELFDRQSWAVWEKTFDMGLERQRLLQEYQDELIKKYYNK